MNKKKCFTLVEVIISSLIVSLVAIFVYSIFASGIHVWKKGNQSRRYQRNIRIFSEKLTRELRNTFEFSNIIFEGTGDSIAFATLIGSSSGEKYYYDEVGKVTYSLNNDNVVCRREQTYPESFQPEEAGTSEELVPGVSQIKFSYCYLDTVTGDYEWKEDWVEEEQDTIPQAIKIELVFLKKSDATKGRFESSKFNKTIFIPIGTGKQSKELG